MSQVWHDDDEFWAAVEPVLFNPARNAGTAAEIDGVLALSGVAPGARVLDLGCGPGRASLELGRRGYVVTGVDRTALYLERGRAAAAAEGLRIEWVLGDMRRFARSASFELVTSLFSTFGFFADDAEERAVARNMAESLAPGGCAVLEMAGKEIIARIFQPRSWMNGEGAELLEERSIRPGFAWVDTRWILHRDGRRYEYPVSLRLYSGAELSRLLLESGFSRVELYGSLAGAPYDNEAKRLVAVARK
ncbi:MAG: methyltransferase domain-containing protein [Polyangiaceae bacterium]|nr:methyltransferase domain-containing protein [Polyangiaceae bacterium]MCE7892922.1 class I SAM-dependent methyltransferase [Sorangiineae bacterium PRO1]MCL4753774.1 methyltransferase domain-containing protein [Myxococcales bacterium]